jgi:hypothetical protein
MKWTYIAHRVNPLFINKWTFLTIKCERLFYQANHGIEFPRAISRLPVGGTLESRGNDQLPRPQARRGSGSHAPDATVEMNCTEPHKSIGLNFRISMGRERETTTGDMEPHWSSPLLNKFEDRREMRRCRSILTQDRAGPRLMDIWDGGWVGRRHQPGT